uniref:Uncharacterized protein n=1 Tax=Trypanosoma vivax (strain Y486) TaxID=1055687 RepID=G0TY60_TRYVY|nr:conserved hypothetical protein [Trypanosoma vivax Y486]
MLKDNASMPEAYQPARGALVLLPQRVSVTALFQPRAVIDENFSVGAVFHSPLQALCRCVVPQSAELAVAAHGVSKNGTARVEVKGSDSAGVGTNSMVRELVLFRSGDICLVTHRLQLASGQDDVCCQWLSRVQRPPLADSTAISALVLLFSSGSADICMECLCDKTEQNSQLVEPLSDTFSKKLRHVRLLLICHGTAIVLSVDGEVLHVSDLWSPLVECGKIEDNQKEYVDSARRSPLTTCALRFFTHYDRNFVFILSASLVPSHALHGARHCFTSALFLLNVLCYGRVEVSVVDIHLLKTDGCFLAFDILPSSYNGGCVMESNRSVLYTGEVLYCTDGFLRSVPCSILCLLSEESVHLVGRFTCTGLGSCAVDLRHSTGATEACLQGKAQASSLAMHSMLPTLLHCVLVPCGCCSCNARLPFCHAVVISFVGAPPLVVISHRDAACPGQGPRWDVHPIDVPISHDNTVVGRVNARHMPFLSAHCCVDARGQTLQSVFCLLQDACGSWCPLVCHRRLETDRTRGKTDCNANLLQWLDELQESSRSFFAPNPPPNECGREDAGLPRRAAPHFFTLGFGC